MIKPRLVSNPTRKYFLPLTLLSTLSATASANIAVEVAFSGASNLPNCQASQIQLTSNGNVTIKDFTVCTGNDIQQSGNGTLSFESPNSTTSCTFKGLTMDSSGRVKITADNSCRKTTTVTTPTSTSGITLVSSADPTSSNLTTLPNTENFNSNQQIILTGVPSTKGGQPGVIQLSQTGANNVQARFNEWGYLDGGHLAEEFDYAVLDKGCFLNDNQNSYIVGSFEHTITGNQSLENGNWKKIAPNILEGCTPPGPLSSVFMTIQPHDGEPVVVRVNNIKYKAFDAALFEDKAIGQQNDQTRAESFTIGYVAFYGNPQGTINIAGTDVDISVKTIFVNEQWKNVNAGFSPAQQIRLQEDENSDYRPAIETRHQTEIVRVLNLDNKFFAQDISFKGKHPFVFRRTDR